MLASPADNGLHSTKKGEVVLWRLNYTVPTISVFQHLKIDLALLTAWNAGLCCLQ